MEHLQSILPNQADHQPCIHNFQRDLNKVGSKHPLKSSGEKTTSGVHQGFISSTAWGSNRGWAGSQALPPKICTHRGLWCGCECCMFVWSHSFCWGQPGMQNTVLWGWAEACWLPWVPMRFDWWTLLTLKVVMCFHTGRKHVHIEENIKIGSGLWKSLEGAPVFYNNSICFAGKNVFSGDTN